MSDRVRSVGRMVISSCSEPVGTVKTAPDEIMGSGAAMRQGCETLTQEERAVLRIEGQWWRFPGAKEAAIREQLGISAATYAARLNRLLDQPAAEAVDPLLIARLRRLRSERRRRRSLTTRTSGGAGNSARLG